MIVALAMVLATGPVFAQLTGELGAHDPSSLALSGSQYYYFATGQGITSRKSTDKTNWSVAPPVFSTPPAWTTQAVPSFTGNFWAPDIAYFNGQYHLYYSVSSWGTIDSAIGVATSPSLVSPTWTDHGKVVQSDAVWEAGPDTDTTGYNAIDPSVLADTDGKVWMAFGSYSSGILVTQIDPTTGKRLNNSTLDATLVANNAPGGGWGSTIEGAALTKHGGNYYLFVNYGGCCSGIDSSYDIRVGRSTSPTGPFLDKNGVDLRNGGGTMFLDDDGREIGPGHFSTYSDSGQDYFGYHYYNGDTNGAPTYGLRKLYWSADGWPGISAVNPDWKGTASGSWGNTANWSNSVIPSGVGHVANFGVAGASRAIVTLDNGSRLVSKINFQKGGPNFTIRRTGTFGLFLDAETGNDATINVQSGSQIIEAPIQAQDPLSINVFGDGTTSGRLDINASLTGSKLNKYGHGTLALNGTSTFTSNIFVRSGTLDISGAVSTPSYVSIGYTSGDNATMIVRGNGSFTTSFDLNLGDIGADTATTGTLYIEDNAAVNMNFPAGFRVGVGYGGGKAAGTVHQTGGTVTESGAGITIGLSTHTTGVYNLSGGAVNGTKLSAGWGGMGTVNQSGGAVSVANEINIGDRPGSVGEWNISGGTLNQTNSSLGFVMIGRYGTGTLTISGNSAVNLAGFTQVGRESSGVGIVNLNGGVLTAKNIWGAAGSGTFNFNGGTLRTSGGLSMRLLTAANVDAGGAIIDTQTFDVIIEQPLLHKAILGETPDGGLRKLGTGLLRLDGVNTYTGPTLINAGTLGGSGTLPGSVSIAAGAKLAPGNSSSGVTGTLTLGSLSLSATSQTNIEVGPSNGASDLLRVIGNAALAGTLNVTPRFASSVPVLGDAFDILDLGSRTGTFSSVNLPSLATGLTWNITKLYTTGIISVIDANYLPGDVDRNGQVSAADVSAMLRALVDLNTYQATRGPNGTALSNQQLLQILDLSGDNKVTNADIQSLMSYFSTGIPSFSVVPEPHSIVLAGFALCFAAALRRSQRRIVQKLS